MYITEDYSYKRSLAIKQCRKGGSTLARIFPDLADSIAKVPLPMRQLKYKFRRDKVDMVVADKKICSAWQLPRGTSVCTPYNTIPFRKSRIRTITLFVDATEMGKLRAHFINKADTYIIPADTPLIEQFLGF